MSYVIGFCCNECAYAAADLAGSTHRKHPANVLVIRIPCSGTFDPSWLVYALARGADAAFVAGCRKGECHYVDGNLKAEKRVAFVKQLLEAVGVEPERVEMFFMASSEPHKFVKAAEEMSKRVEKLGPLPRRGRIDRVRLGKKENLVEALKAIAKEFKDIKLPEIPGFKVPVYDESCIGCGACVEACERDALRMVDSDGFRRILLNAARCTACGDCVKACEESGESSLRLGGMRMSQLISDWSEGIRMPLVACEVCGKYFATEGELRKADSPQICPSCKEVLSAKAMSFGKVRA
jgi:F420-non-reducing hydrogenase iron-sulfur subunit